MGENSKIEWTTHTFNGVRGCTKISPGCEHCYAEAGSKRNPNVLGIWGPRGTRVLAAESGWREVLGWNEVARKASERHRVFSYSLADWLEEWPGQLKNSKGELLWWHPKDPRTEAVACQNRAGMFPGNPHPEFQPYTLTQARARLLGHVAQTPHLDWLLLSKRVDGWADRMHEIVHHTHDGADVIASHWLDGTPLPNVWLGASVEDRRYGLPRIEHLRQIPAAVRFLSVEPLLEDLGTLDLTGIHWVIVGGESGHGARPMHPQWVRSIRDQCVTAGVSFFFKQWGRYRPGGAPVGTRTEWVHASGLHYGTGEHIRGDKTTVEQMADVGKKAAGRLLDGREWSEFPRLEVVDV